MSIDNALKQGGMQGQGVGVAVARQPRKRHVLRNMLLVVLLIAVVWGGISVASLAYRASYQFYVQVGNQQATLVDLRQSFPVSPYLLGANVFPEAGTDSLDQAGSGFMSYGAPITKGLDSAHIKLLRFPGGNWGEQHAYSFDQLNAFSTLLMQTGAAGMMQVQLSDVNGQTGSLATRISRAGLIVDYMNNKNSIQRAGRYAQAPFKPVSLWTIGNEPDRLLNPDTGLTYTAGEYAQTFIQFSITMHQNDPHIRVFGPEISQFYGLGVGPKDATGTLWIEEFLQKISAYERQHPTLPFHVLDGVSFHRYQFNDARHATAQLLASTDEWEHLLPTLRQLVRQNFQRDMPIGVTEVNTNPNAQVPARNLAAVWWADTLGMLMSQHADYVAFFSAEGVDTPYPLFSTNGLQETPMLRVMQLFARLQRNFVPVQTQSDAVSVYATRDDGQQTVGLLLINKTASTQQVQVSTATGFLPVSPWKELHLKLGAYSIAVVTLHRDGGAEASSYATPASDPTTPTLVYTICGNASNGAAEC